APESLSARDLALLRSRRGTDAVPAPHVDVGRRRSHRLSCYRHRAACQRAPTRGGHPPRPRPPASPRARCYHAALGEPPALASRYRLAVLALIVGVQTATNVGALGLPSLAPMIRADLGLSRQEAGSFISAFYVGGVLTSLPAGWLADRVGVRWTLLAGQGLVAACFAAMMLARGYAGLVGAVLLAGVGYGAVNPTSTKGVLVWFPAASRATVVGIKQAGFPLGGAIGALLLPSAAEFLGWRGALGIAAGLIGASAAAAGIGYREPPASGPSEPGAAPGRPRVD